MQGQAAPLVVLADDLTGAADCAARCHQAGLPATICVQPPALPLPAGAVAITTDSRQLAPACAAERVRMLLDILQGTPVATWYKKIDSTLRGNIGAELDAMLDALGQRCAVLCPAFPAQGRGLEGGRLVGTVLPAQSVHVPTLLASQSVRRVEAIPLSCLRAGPEVLARRMDTAHRAGAQVLVVDALADVDLDTIVAATEALPAPLLCGSAGLMGALAARHALRGRLSAVQGPSPRRPTGLGGVLLVIGSGSPQAHAQVAYLRQQGVPTHEVGIGPLPAGQGDLLLHLPEPRDAALEGPAAREAATVLADAALAALVRRQPAVLVLSGGDTAITLLHRLGIARLTVVRELLPGMPLTWAVDVSGTGYFVILKAGNHGDHAALAALVAQARAEL